jgi:hypothetical protein
MKKVEDLERRDKSFAKRLSLIVENVTKGRKKIPNYRSLTPSPQVGSDELYRITFPTKNRGA